MASQPALDAKFESLGIERPKAGRSRPALGPSGAVQQRLGLIPGYLYDWPVACVIQRPFWIFATRAVFTPRWFVGEKRTDGPPKMSRNSLPDSNAVIIDSVVRALPASLA